MITRIIIAIISFLLTLAFFVSIYLFTPIGIKLSIFFIKRNHYLSALEYQNLQGTMISPISLQNIHFENKFLSINIKKLYLKWNFKDIFHKKITIEKLIANGVEVNAKQLQNILKSNIEIAELNIQNVEINKTNIQGSMSATFIKPYKFTALLLFKGLPANYHVNLKLGGKDLHSVINGEGHISTITLKTDSSHFFSGVLKGFMQINAAKDTYKINLTGNHINLKFVNPELPSPLDIHLISSGEWKSSPKFMLQGVAASSDVRLTLQGKYDKKGQINWEVRGNKFPKIMGNINFYFPDYKGKGMLKANENIKGTIYADLNDLTFLNAYMPNITISQGAIHSRLNIQGVLTHPLLSGIIELNNGKMSVLPLKTTFAAINGSGKLEKNNIHYKVKAYVDNEPIDIIGQTNFEGDTNLSINGKNILLLNTDQYQIYVSPEIEASIKNKIISAKGNVFIPKANLKPYDFSQTTTLPEDTVILSKEKIIPASKWITHYQLKIILGDEVFLNTRGLKGELKGSLMINNSVYGGNIANGHITLENGSYSAYGHTLTIMPNSGIDFINQPFSDPSLNINVARKIKTIFDSSTPTFGLNELLVGFNIRGTLKKPALNLFSKPAGLSQADMLSYLVLGHASQSGGNKIGTIVQLASQLKLGKQSEGIGSSISQKLGFSELGVEDQETIDLLGTPTGEDRSAFVIGRYLSPRIYVRYSQTVGSPSNSDFNIFQARYLFNNRWAAQIESSNLGSGVDILYTVNKN